VLTAHDREAPLGPARRNDAAGVKQRGYPLRALRSKLSQLMFADNHPEADRRGARGARPDRADSTLCPAEVTLWWCWPRRRRVVRNTGGR